MLFVPLEVSSSDAGAANSQSDGDVVDTQSLGLTSSEVEQRRLEFGSNEFRLHESTSVVGQFVVQLVHFFALLLWIAGILAFIAGMPQLGIAVFVIVVLNALFAFVQERRAGHAAERLRKLLPRSCTVIRDGTPIVLDSGELVVGDLVVLSEGDRISADLEIRTSASLAVDTSSLTGESIPEHLSEGDRLFTGSFVVEGEARATVIAVGTNTRFAALSQMTTAGSRPRTPLRVELERISRLIAAMAASVGVAFFAVSVLIKSDPSDAFLFGVGVSVALVPEGLLPTVTLSLALGAQRMSERKALVRHLEAAETLGSTTFICTDKTGTLTRNEMQVVEVWTPNGRATLSGEGYAPEAIVTFDSDDAASSVAGVALASARCGSGRAVCVDGSWEARGDPMEAALVALSARCGNDLEADEIARPEVLRFPFDARRRRMTVVVGDEVIVKGAPDAVLPLCVDGAGAEVELHRLASSGLRVLAIAIRRLDGPLLGGERAEDLECRLRLLGLVGLEDPPRRGVANALESCRRAGVRVAMVTGDHPRTAAAIAAEIGLSTSDSPVIVGDDLVGDDAEVAQQIDHDGIVIARVSPENKLRITRALQRRGHVVAMTGDGVNDAPALRASSIGIAMGKSGTDVARDAADLILLDDDFSTIVSAIEQGRSTYANIRRFLTYYLAGNVAELAPFVIWALSGGRIPLAIGVLQILALDVGTSVLPALALGAQPPDPRTLGRPRELRHLLTRAVFFRAFVLLGPALAIAEMVAFFAAFGLSGWRPGEAFPIGASLAAASGAAFTSVVLGQAANSFACRSTTRVVWKVPFGANRFLLVAVAVELILLAVFLIPPISVFLGQAIPSPGAVLVAMCSMPLIVLCDSLQKTMHQRRSRSTVAPEIV